MLAAIGWVAPAVMRRKYILSSNITFHYLRACRSFPRAAPGAHAGRVRVSLSVIMPNGESVPHADYSAPQQIRRRLGWHFRPNLLPSALMPPAEVKLEYDTKGMPFRRLGSSGLRVPVFSLGGCK